MIATSLVLRVDHDGPIAGLARHLPLAFEVDEQARGGRLLAAQDRLDEATPQVGSRKSELRPR